MTDGRGSREGSSAPDASTVHVRSSFPGANGLRAIGALLVLTTHVGFQSGDSLHGSLNGFLSRLDVGVAVFFVISGFLLFRPHAAAWVTDRPRPSTTRYLWHRALRILPALWCAVAGAALLLGPVGESTLEYLRHATLTQIYGARGLQTPGLTQMWSLATEVAFYLVLPALAAALTYGEPTPRAVRARLVLLLLSPFAGAAWMATSAALEAGQLALWLPGYVGWFGLGMALALWHAGRSAGLLPGSSLDQVAQRPGTVWGAAAAVYLVVISPVAGPYSLAQATPGQAVVKSLAYATLGAMAVLPAVAARSGTADPPGVRRLGGALGTFFGNISYGIFCYHLIVLALVQSWTDHQVFTGGFWRLYVPTLVGAVAVATLSYYGVERPIMRRGRRRSPSPAVERPVRTTPATAQAATATRTEP
ncbi:MAG: acyltransferase family protein [Dermatophilaceae bacterium]